LAKYSITKLKIANANSSLLMEQYMRANAKRVSLRGKVLSQNMGKISRESYLATKVIGICLSLMGKEGSKYPIV
jgi:hypothetical protein